jgi:hypothetical protein
LNAAPGKQPSAKDCETGGRWRSDPEPVSKSPLEVLRIASDSDRHILGVLIDLTEFSNAPTLSLDLTEVRMGARSKDFTIAFLLTALDVLVVRDNGSAVWQVWGEVPWVRFCLLLLAGVAAFTLSDVWAYAFRRPQRFAMNVRPNPNSEPNVSGCAVEGADV